MELIINDYLLAPASSISDFVTGVAAVVGTDMEVRQALVMCREVLGKFREVFSQLSTAVYF